MATSLEVSTVPMGSILNVHVRYQYGEPEATVEVTDGINIVASDYSHEDLTELINALNKVRCEMEAAR